MLAGAVINSNIASGPTFNLYGLSFQKGTKTYFDGSIVAYADDTTADATALALNAR